METLRSFQEQENVSTPISSVCRMSEVYITRSLPPERTLMTAPGWCEQSTLINLALRKRMLCREGGGLMAGTSSVAPDGTAPLCASPSLRFGAGSPGPD